MAKLNVYLPDGLKAEMDKIPDSHWSRIAQDAFERFIHLQKLKEGNMSSKTKEAGIERLRKSKEAKTEELKAAFFQIGRNWALEEGEYDEVSRIAALPEANNVEDIIQALCGPEYDVVDNDFLERYTMRFAFDTVPETDLEYALHGFLEGVKEVFEDI